MAIDTKINLIARSQAIIDEENLKGVTKTIVGQLLLDTNETALQDKEVLFYLQGNNTTRTLSASQFNRTLTDVTVTLKDVAAAEYVIPLTADGNNVVASPITIPIGGRFFTTATLATTSLPAWTDLISVLPDMGTNEATIEVTTTSDYVEVAIPLPLLNAPVASTLTVLTSTSLRFTWTDPNTSPQETGVLVEYDTDVNFGSPVQLNLPTDTTTVDFTGLTVDVPIYARVIAKGDGVANDDSLPSNVLNETPTVPATLYVGNFVNPQSYLNFGNKGDYEVALWRVTMDLEFHDVGIFQRFCNINIKDGADAANLEGIRIGRYDGGNIEVVTGTAGGQNTTQSSTLVPYDTRVVIRIERTVDTTDIFIDDVEVSYSSQNTYSGANLWGTGNTQFGRQNAETATNFDGILYSMKYEEINSSGVVQQEIISLQPVSDNTLTSWTNTGTEAPASSDGLWVLGTVVQDDQWVVNP